MTAVYKTGGTAALDPVSQTTIQSFKPAVGVVVTNDVPIPGSFYDGSPLDADLTTLSIVGDLVLLTAQADPTQNGIYLIQPADSGSLIRAEVMDENADILPGLIVKVLGGTYAGTEWQLITAAPIEMDTSELTFRNNSAYSATTPSDWAVNPPPTLQEASDRMSQVLARLNGEAIPAFPLLQAFDFNDLNPGDPVDFVGTPPMEIDFNPGSVDAQFTAALAADSVDGTGSALKYNTTQSTTVSSTLVLDAVTNGLSAYKAWDLRFKIKKFGTSAGGALTMILAGSIVATVNGNTGQWRAGLYSISGFPTLNGASTLSTDFISVRLTKDAHGVVKFYVGAVVLTSSVNLTPVPDLTFSINSFSTVSDAGFIIDDISYNVLAVN